jgi:hypothetical protein
MPVLVLVGANLANVNFLLVLFDLLRDRPLLPLLTLHLRHLHARRHVRLDGVNFLRQQLVLFALHDDLGVAVDVSLVLVDVEVVHRKFFLVQLVLVIVAVVVFFLLLVDLFVVLLAGLAGGRVWYRVGLQNGVRGLAVLDEPVAGLEVGDAGRADLLWQVQLLSLLELI